MMRMQGTWRMEPYDLAEVVDDAVKAYQSRAGAKKITLVNQSEGAPEAIGDARAVRRVIDNLIVNALKFTPEGGHIRVTVIPHGPDLRPTVSQTPDRGSRPKSCPWVL